MLFQLVLPREEVRDTDYYIQSHFLHTYKDHVLSGDADSFDTTLAYMVSLDLESLELHFVVHYCQVHLDVALL